MADISKIVLPNGGGTYDLKDAVAREDIKSLKNSVTGGMHYVGITTTKITDGSTTGTITVDNNEVIAKAGDVAIYGELEYVWSGTKWQEFGSTGSLKALAFKDNASAQYTPQGVISDQTFTGEAVNVESAYTPDGNVAISVASSGDVNYTPTGNVTKPEFTGTEATIESTFTPSGNVSMSIGDGASNYTPAGTISAPEVTVDTTKASVTSIDSVGELPTLTTTVENETLTLGFTQGSLPTKAEAVDVITGATAKAAAPAFTGTGVELKAAFVGTSGKATATYTPTGEVSKPDFTGTGVNLAAEFTGVAGTAIGSVTAKGSVSKATFNGTETTITVE